MLQKPAIQAILSIPSILSLGVAWSEQEGIDGVAGIAASCRDCGSGQAARIDRVDRIDGIAAIAASWGGLWGRASLAFLLVSQSMFL